MPLFYFIIMIGGFRKAESLKKIMDTIDRNEIYTRNHRIKLKNTEVYCSSIGYLSGKLIIVFDPSMESLKKYHTTLSCSGGCYQKYYGKDSLERAFKLQMGENGYTVRNTEQNNGRSNQKGLKI